MPACKEHADFAELASLKIGERQKAEPSSMLLASDVFLTSFHCELRFSLSVDESLLEVLADWLGLGVLNS